MAGVASSDGGALRPDGFWSSVVAVPTEKGNLNFTVVGTDQEAQAFGAFTNSDSASAAVKWSRTNLAASGRHLIDGRAVTIGPARAVLIVSNHSNSGTGAQGRTQNRLLAEATARSLGVRPQEILMASTGVIGRQYPNFDELVAAAEGTNDRVVRPVQWEAVAAGICTFLDMNRQKTASRPVADGSGASIAAACKGSNMIYPSLSGFAPPHSTTIAVVTTDAILPPEVFWRIAQGAVDASFNRLNVDGARSTSDSLFILSSGTRSVDSSAFAEALEGLLVDLVKMIARDGLGGRRGLWIDVEGAISIDQAERVGRSMAMNAHLKYAIYGNPLLIPGSAWAAVGAAGAGDIIEDRLEIQINETTVFRGEVLAHEASTIELPEGRDVIVRVNLGQGSARVRWHTCDQPKPQPSGTFANADVRLG